MSSAHLVSLNVLSSKQDLRAYLEYNRVALKMHLLQQNGHKRAIRKVFDLAQDRVAVCDPVVSAIPPRSVCTRTPIAHTPKIIAFVRGSLRKVWWSIRSQKSFGCISGFAGAEATLSAVREWWYR